MLRKEKEKASTYVINLDLKPPYFVEIETKPYLIGYLAPQFQKFYERSGNTCADVMRFLHVRSKSMPERILKVAH